MYSHFTVGFFKLFYRGYLPPLSSPPWLDFCLLMKSGKHISLHGAPPEAGLCWLPRPSGRGSPALRYAPRWNNDRKVSVMRFWHLLIGGRETPSFCFFTFHDTAHWPLCRTSIEESPIMLQCREGSHGNVGQLHFVQETA